MFVLYLSFVNFMKFSTVSVVFPKILAVNLVLIMNMNISNMLLLSKVYLDQQIQCS